MARNKEKINAFEGLDFEAAAAPETPAQEEPKKVHENSLANLRPRQSGTATPKAYMQLNVYEYEDYIYRMAKAKGVSMTQYVLDLIEKDRQENAQAYEGLKLLKHLDKPERVAKNTKKSR